MKVYPMLKNIQPTNIMYGFEMEGYWVWCGSVIPGEDGKYHMFSARWPKSLPFYYGYLVASEIVHAISDTPEGPYTYYETVLSDRGEQYWDGRMTHNPSVIKYNDTYLLFYIGSTYKGEQPGFKELTEAKPMQAAESGKGIRIGVATSKSIYGPWKRSDAPVLDIDKKSWDCTVVTNPAPCITPKGDILLYYRSNTPKGLQIGVAKANGQSLNFHRITERPVFEKYEGMSVEDPFVWHNGENYELIAKDMTGSICGEKWGGVHMMSEDGVNWDFVPERKAYSRIIRWTDNTSSEAFHLERPNITFINNKPALICFAYAEGGGKTYAYGYNDFDMITMSKTLIIPLTQE